MLRITEHFPPSFSSDITLVGIRSNKNRRQQRRQTLGFWILCNHTQSSSHETATNGRRDEDSSITKENWELVITERRLYTNNINVCGTQAPRATHPNNLVTGMASRPQHTQTDTHMGLIRLVVYYVQQKREKRKEIYDVRRRNESKLTQDERPSILEISTWLCRLHPPSETLIHAISFDWQKWKKSNNTTLLGHGSFG